MVALSSVWTDFGKSRFPVEPGFPHLQKGGDSAAWVSWEMSGYSAQGRCCRGCWLMLQLVGPWPHQWPACELPGLPLGLRAPSV